MVDRRFFDDLGPVSLAQLAAQTGATVRGDPDRTVSRAAPLGGADLDSLSFLSDRRHAAAFRASAAGAVFVTPDVAATVEHRALLVHLTPQAAFADAVGLLHRPRSFATAGIDPAAMLEAEVQVGPNVQVGPGAAIGARTVLGPNVVVGPGVQIGRDCRIGANCVIGFALIGDRVTLYAGVVVGEPGFGVAVREGGALVEMPQLGRVVIQDGVSIGATTTIDRGAFDDTVIGEGSRLDNGVQIAHNVVVGRNVVLAAHCGISGSCVIEDGAMLGGRVGLADHVTIGRGARLAAFTGVMRDVPAGEFWGGLPSRPVPRWMRENALLSKMAQGRGFKPAGRGKDEA